MPKRNSAGRERTSRHCVNLLSRRRKKEQKLFTVLSPYRLPPNLGSLAPGVSRRAKRLGEWRDFKVIQRASPTGQEIVRGSWDIRGTATRFPAPGGRRHRCENVSHKYCLPLHNICLFTRAGLKHVKNYQAFRSSTGSLARTICKGIKNILKKSL